MTLVYAWAAFYFGGVAALTLSMLYMLRANPGIFEDEAHFWRSVLMLLLWPVSFPYGVWISYRQQR